MKGFAMLKIGEIGWIEKDRPECGFEDAIIRPIALAPCTSDVHTIWEGAIGEKHNLILGHEAIGVVDEVGDKVKDFKPGDRVIVPAITPDWGSNAAQRGYPSQSGETLGGWKFSNHKDGVFGEYFHVNQADYNLAMLPPDMSLEAAIMLPDMLSTGFMGAELAEIEFGSKVAVMGVGPVGLCSIAGAKLKGAGRIFAVGTRAESIKVAREYGATDIVDYRKGTIEQILDATDGEGVDAVIISGGGPGVLMDAVKIAKPGSVISNNNYFSSGIGEEDILPVPRMDWGVGMAYKTITGGLCPGGRVRMERLAEMVTHGRIDPSLLATHVMHGFDKIEKAVLMMKEKPEGMIKPVILLE